MKKLVMGLLGAMMILSLAACTPTTEKNKTGEVKEPQQEEVVESTADAGPGVVTGRPVDQDAPDLTMVSVYSVSEDGSKIEGTMDSVEILDAQSLVDLLVQYGVLDNGTEGGQLHHRGQCCQPGSRSGRNCRRHHGRKGNSGIKPVPV